MFMKKLEVMSAYIEAFLRAFHAKIKTIVENAIATP
jgi:hypothetical protein